MVLSDSRSTARQLSKKIAQPAPRNPEAWMKENAVSFVAFSGAFRAAGEGRRELEPRREGQKSEKGGIGRENKEQRGAKERGLRNRRIVKRGGENNMSEEEKRMMASMERRSQKHERGCDKKKTKEKDRMRAF